MATQYKKIQNKLHPKEAEQGKTDLKPKASRDALLLVLIALTLVILAIGWNTMDDKRGCCFDSYLHLFFLLPHIFISVHLYVYPFLRQFFCDSSFFMTAKVRLFDEVHKFFQIFILEEQMVKNGGYGVVKR